MSNVTLQFQASDPWIFLSIAAAAPGRVPAPPSEIIGLADAINHAIPTELELEGVFTRLLQAGLIRQEQKELGLTAQGMDLVRRSRQRSEHWLGPLDFLAELVLFVLFTILVYTMDTGFMTPYGAIYLLSPGLAFGISIRMRQTVEAVAA